MTSPTDPVTNWMNSLGFTPLNKSFTKGKLYVHHDEAEFFYNVVQQQILAARQKSREAIWHIHMAHDWNDTSQDLKDWLMAELHDINRMSTISDTHVPSPSKGLVKVSKQLKGLSEKEETE